MELVLASLSISRYFFLTIVRKEMQPYIRSALIVIGLLQDIITPQFFGLAALSKTIAGFVAGYFFNENTAEQTLGSYRYVLLVALCSVVHDLLYFIIFLQGTGGSVFISTIEYTMGMTLYTCIISVLPMFFYSRKYNTPWSQ